MLAITHDPSARALITRDSSGCYKCRKKRSYAQNVMEKNIHKAIRIYPFSDLNSTTTVGALSCQKKGLRKKVRINLRSNRGNVSVVLCQEILEICR